MCAVEVLTAVTIKTEVCDMTPCGHVVNYWHHLQNSFLYPENVGSRFLRTSGTSLPEYESHSFTRAVAGELVFRFLLS
jgi:hypothetical protein